MACRKYFVMEDGNTCWLCRRPITTGDLFFISPDGYRHHDCHSHQKESKTMLATLSYDTKHIYTTAMGPAAAPTVQSSRVSLALSTAFRGAGIPYPSHGLDYNSIKVRLEGDMLVLSYIRHVRDTVEYSNASLRTESVEALIQKSSLISGIPGVIAESIKFTIEED
jgi:hypothetical protein